MTRMQAMRNMRAAQDVSSLMVSSNERMLRRHSDINASDVAAVATRCVLTRTGVMTGSGGSKETYSVQGDSSALRPGVGLTWMFHHVT